MRLFDLSIISVAASLFIPNGLLAESAPPFPGQIASVVTSGVQPAPAPVVVTSGVQPAPAPVVVTSGVQPAPAPVVVTSGVQPAPAPINGVLVKPPVIGVVPFPGVVVKPPTGVVPMPFPGVIVRPPQPVEHPTETADLFAFDDDEGTQALSGITLTMNETGTQVSSFLLSQQGSPACPKGAMCPSIAWIAHTRFKVIRTYRDDCGREHYLGQVEPDQMAGAPVGLRPRRLTVVDYREDECYDDFDSDWKVTLTQGTTRSLWYGEPIPAPAAQ